MRRLLLSLAVSSLAASTAAAALPPAQNLLFTGQAASGLYAAFVDPAAATIQVVSQGGLIVSPWTIAQGPDGWLYVGNSNNIVRINP